ncbi:MAG: HPr family phosphocarrier protein [Clostridiales bacterium]|nr:HPr family phosphocarrier protein [Clostridiales bacterium]
MIEKKLVIGNEIGLKARTASMLVREATKYKAESIIVKDGDEYDCKSIMNILTMSAKKEEEVLLKVEGPDEKIAMKNLEMLITKNTEY